MSTATQGLTHTTRFHVEREEKGTLVLAFPDQSASEDASFSYTFPADTFSDPDGDTLG